MIGAHVRVTNPTRPYYGQTGTVEKTDKRDGKAYLGVKFEGVAHIVWFFEFEVVGV